VHTHTHACMHARARAHTHTHTHTSNELQTNLKNSFIQKIIKHTLIFSF